MARLRDKRIQLEITDEAKQYLGRVGYSETFGARPLKRVIQNEVETKMAKLIVSGQIAEGSTVIVNVRDNQIVLDVVQKV